MAAEPMIPPGKKFIFVIKKEGGLQAKSKTGVSNEAPRATVLFLPPAAPSVREEDREEEGGMRQNLFLPPLPPPPPQQMAADAAPAPLVKRREREADAEDREDKEKGEDLLSTLQHISVYGVANVTASLRRIRTRPLAEQFTKRDIWEFCAIHAPSPGARPPRTHGKDPFLIGASHFRRYGEAAREFEILCQFCTAGDFDEFLQKGEGTGPTKTMWVWATVLLQHREVFGRTLVDIYGWQWGLVEDRYYRREEDPVLLLQQSPPPSSRKRKAPAAALLSSSSPQLLVHLHNQRRAQHARAATEGESSSSKLPTPSSLLERSLAKCLRPYAAVPIVVLKQPYMGDYTDDGTGEGGGGGGTTGSDAAGAGSSQLPRAKRNRTKGGGASSSSSFSKKTPTLLQ